MIRRAGFRNWTRHGKIFVTLASVLAVLAVGGCAQMQGENARGNETETVELQEQTGAVNEKGRYENMGSMPIHDNKSLYEMDNDLAVPVLYLTVQKGSASEGTNHTWQEVNEHSVYYYEERGIDRYKVDAILKVGNESGPVFGEFGYGDFAPNATVSIRGQSSTYGGQKSYKIKIKDGKGSYKDQKTINLNKHVYDGLRFRNKLCYDLMEELPGMMSARTQFVHLYVKDLTSEESSGKYEDYGLYTQVEQINRTYLKNHGLDKNGQLYKINFFEFYRYEDVILPSSDSGYDLKAFENYLEVKGDTDHGKLIEMLEDLNDETIPIETTFEKWFDEENVFSWLAFHILVGNKDTQSRNFFLYSPQNVDKWYFISWDNDAAFRDAEVDVLGTNEGKEWMSGISNYWGNQLFRRILKSEVYRGKLDDKIQEYRGIITAEKLSSMAAAYDTVVGQYLQKLPDITYLNITFEERAEILRQFPAEVEKNYRLYLESLENPQPFYIGVPQMTEDGLNLTWDTSYDFENQDITYTVELAQDYSFENPVYRSEGIFSPNIHVKTELVPGKYFVRIKASDEDGNSQYAFDTYVSETGEVYGVKCFYLTQDGGIVEDVYVE